MLTKLMDISANVRLDSQDSTVKLVSTPSKFDQSHIHNACHAISSCSGSPCYAALDIPGRHWPEDLARLFYIMLTFFRAF